MQVGQVVSFDSRWKSAKGIENLVGKRMAELVLSADNMGYKVTRISRQILSIEENAKHITFTYERSADEIATNRAFGFKKATGKIGTRSIRKNEAFMFI